MFSINHPVSLIPDHSSDQPSESATISDQLSIGEQPSALNPQPAPPRLAYILSASHSGSTLLAMLLGAHPDACTVGELKLTSMGDVNQYRCSCGDRLMTCSFWRSEERRVG